MLSDKGVQQFSKLCGDTLLTVSISGNKLLTDKSVKYLTKYCSILESVDLKGLDLRENTIRGLIEKCSETMHAINIGRCEGLSDEFVRGEMLNIFHDCLIYRRT